MPKINVYVPDDMYEWMRENEVKPSAEFQARIKEIQSSTPSRAEPERRKVGRALVRRGRVRLSPGQEPIGTAEEDGKTYVLYLE